MSVCNLAITLHSGQLDFFLLALQVKLHNRSGQVTSTHHTHLSTVRSAQQEEIDDGIFWQLTAAAVNIQKITKPPAGAKEAICLGACVRWFLPRLGIGGKKLIQTLPPDGRPVSCILTAQDRII